MRKKKKDKVSGNNGVTQEDSQGILRITAMQQAQRAFNPEKGGRQSVFKEISRGGGEGGGQKMQ